jgi:hypothetical protein
MEISETAEEYIHKEIASGEYRRPIVAVCRSRGDRDLKRGPQGEALWESTGPGWLATIIDLAEIDEWARPVTSIQGFPVSIISTSDGPSRHGLILDIQDGKLRVRYREV